MTPWNELLFRALISWVGVAIFSFIYVEGANWIRRKFHGGLTEVIFSACGIICVSILILAPFIYLITAAQGMVLGDDGLIFLGATAVAWALSMAVAFYIIFPRIQKLRAIAIDKNTSCLSPNSLSDNSMLSGDDFSVGGRVEIAIGKFNIRQVVARLLALITFPASGALTMTAISMVALRQIPLEHTEELLGIGVGFFAIVVAADIGNRLWNYHAARTGVIGQDVAERLQCNRKLPSALAHYDFTKGKLVLLFVYTCILAVWIPWDEVPIAWRWLNIGIISLPLTVIFYTFLRNYFRGK